MTMKRLCATALTIAWALCALAAEKSGTIVYINGSKYYIHTVQPGETLYGLSKTYGVGEKVILENNPSIARGLKTAENIKIPFVSDVPSRSRTGNCARPSISISCRRAKRFTPFHGSMKFP